MSDCIAQKPAVSGEHQHITQVAHTVDVRIVGHAGIGRKIASPVPRVRGINGSVEKNYGALLRVVMGKDIILPEQPGAVEQCRRVDMKDAL